MITIRKWARRMPKSAWFAVVLFVQACGGAQPAADDPKVAPPESRGSEVVDAGADGRAERAEAARRALLEEAAQYGMIGLTEVCSNGPDGGAAQYPCEIQRTIRASFGRMLVCYEESLKRKPGLAGRITVRFAIDSTGHVAEATRHDASTLDDEDVARCIVHEFERLTFPPPSIKGKVTITYPIIFSERGKP